MVEAEVVRVKSQVKVVKLEVVWAKVEDTGTLVLLTEWNFARALILLTE